jgi:hypothetical protein
MNLLSCGRLLIMSLFLPPYAMAAPVAEPDSPAGTDVILDVRDAEITVAQDVELLSTVLQGRQQPSTAVQPRQVTDALISCVSSGAAPYQSLYTSLGYNPVQLSGLYISGALLVFGGELSDMAKRNQWLLMSISVMLSCNDFCSSGLCS